MKKIIGILILGLLLTSCGMTQEEKLNKIQECKEIGVGYFLNDFEEIICGSRQQNKVMDCIKEYTNGIDEKYNNPDTVTNLREDEYSNVVKTCNEIFGDKEI